MADDREPEARFFVTPYDPSGVMMTVRKYREHLTLEEARSLQEESSEQGVTLLIYRERTADPSHDIPRRG